MSPSREDRLAEGVAKLEERLKRTFPHYSDHLSAMPRDKILAWTKAMLAHHDAFQQSNVPVKVDTAWHHTRGENMHSIRSHGLLTLRERQAKNIESQFHGSSCGDGVYTVNHRAQYAEFGDKILLVLRLRAKESNDRNDTNHHTYYDGTSVVVLRSSWQCVALMEFAVGLVNDDNTFDNNVCEGAAKLLEAAFG